MLGFPILYFKGMRLMMFQLSSFYCIREQSLSLLYYTLACCIIFTILFYIVVYAF